MVSFLLTVAGFAILLVAITGISAGLVLSLNSRTRGDGVFFVLLWVPLLVVSLGILWRDGPTSAVGAACFVVATAAVAFRERSRLLPMLSRRRNSGRGSRRKAQNKRGKS